MVAVVGSNPTGSNLFFLLFKTFDVNFVQKCQICVENEKPVCLNFGEISVEHTRLATHN